jgi:penicillin amidase
MQHSSRLSLRSRLRSRPLEFRLLGLHPTPFHALDVYAVAHLKYFINSTWKAEILQTRLAQQFSPQRFQELFTTYSQENSASFIEPVFPASFIPTVVQEVMSGLRILGLDEPDLGSNVFVLKGKRSATGYPIIACDPHMGHVNPSFNLLFKLRSQESLNVCGANFPGVPGIYTGRNQAYGWGMVGLMADNQDLFCGEVQLKEGLVKIQGKWHVLEKTQHLLGVKGEATSTLETYAFPQGKLLFLSGSYGLFLRWLALDSPLGDIVLYDLNCGKNWEDFRTSLKQIYTSPMMVGYGDREGNIALQAIGLLPRRSAFPGSFILSLENPAYAWKGYLSFEELPHRFNPEEDFLIYSNHYSKALFEAFPYVSNRWHPPSRVLRIEELLQEFPLHTSQSVIAIQEDRHDFFCKIFLEKFSSFLTPNPFAEWKGESRFVKYTLLFEEWFSHLSQALLADLSEDLRREYQEQWPMYRWNLLHLLMQRQEKDISSLKSLLQESLAQAQIKVKKAPPLLFRHSLGKGFWGSFLFNLKAPYRGGTRETVHVERKNIDFLSSGQGAETQQSSFNFGPSFKLLLNLDPQGDIFYLSSTANECFPFSWKAQKSFKQSCAGKRFVTHLDDSPKAEV